MATEIRNLNYFLSYIPVKVRLREKGVPKKEQKIVEKEHMNGNCNTILCAFIEMKVKGQMAQPSVKSLANLIGGSTRTVIRCLDILELSGLIEKTRRGCGSNNIYRISLELWKRLYVGLKKEPVEKEEPIVSYEIHHAPRPKGYRMKCSSLGFLEAIEMLENNYEEAIKPE